MKAAAGNARAETPPDLPRRLGLLDSVSVVVGTMIGVGIFIVPSSIARELPSVPLIIAVWLATGVVSVFGALAYAELGAMMPRSGGQYVYLREAYGPLPAFLCGWSFLLVIQTGSIATVSVGFGTYLSYLLPWLPGVSTWAPPLLIAALTAINYRGVRAGANVQLTFTALKLLGLVLLMAAAFTAAPRAPGPLAPAPEVLPLRGLGFAMLGCFVAYDGWHVIAFLGGEVRRPSRNLPLALAIGVAAVVAIYVLANVAYMRVLSVAEIAASPHVAATTAERTMGPLGATMITLTIVLSSAGACNGAVMTAPRIYFAQARDGLFFHRLAEIHPRFQTPSISILVQGVWAMLLALTGSYETLFTYTMFISWVVHGLAVLSLVVLRAKQPDAARPYRMWGYPAAPLLFVAFAAWFIVSTLVERPAACLFGAAVIAAGLPVYSFWSRRLKPSRKALAGAFLLVASIGSAQTLSMTELEELSRVLSASDRVSGRQMAENLLQRARSNPDALLALGRTLASQKELALAEQAFARAAELAPQSFEANFNLGLALVQQSKFAQAAAPLSEAARLQPASFEPNYLLGIALSQAGKRIEAIERLRSAAKVRPRHIGLLTLLGLLYVEEDYPLDAAESLEQAAKEAPLEERAALVLAEAYHRSFDFEKALRQAGETARRFVDSPDAHFRLGYELETAGRFEEARQAFERAAALRPAFAEPHLALGRGDLRAGRYDEARRRFELVLSTQPKHRQVRVELAKALVGLKHYERPKELLAAVIAEGDTEPEPHLLLSRIYQAEGDRVSSARERKRFLELSRAAPEGGGMSANLSSRKLRRFR